MIKKKSRIRGKVNFGKKELYNNKLMGPIIPKYKRNSKKWKSIEKLSCKSSEFTDIDGIDLFYRLFHHDLRNKDKLKEIINDINNENEDSDEKIITGQDLLKFTPIIYSLTKNMIKENTKEYRKFQKSSHSLNKKGFKNWWSVAHGSPHSNQGIGKVILDLRKFWAVFFSSFSNFKNFQEFEREVLGGNDKLSIDYSDYVKTLTNRGVPKFIDPSTITITHHDNNLKIFTDWSIFSEIWRLNKPIFCTYRTLFLECTSGVKEIDNCPFNNWKSFNFKKLKEQELEDISAHLGDLVMQNNEKSIIGYINTGEDWKQDEINRMFERDNPISRARLLENAESAAERSKHSHGVDGKIAHTHSNNPANNSSEDYIRQQARAQTEVKQNWTRQYGLEGLDSNDPSLLTILKDPAILKGYAETRDELKGR